jgi:hypothetical protein
MAPALARAKLRAMVSDLAGPPPRLWPADGGAGGGAAAGGVPGGGGGQEPESLEETKLEFLEGLWAPTVLLPREGKAFVTLSGLAAGSVSAVLDAAGPSSDYTSIAGAFAFGGVLGLALAPRWAVTYELASQEGPSGAAGAQSGGGGAGAVTGPGSSLSGSLDGGGGGPVREYWRPALADTESGRARANAAVGAAAALYAALGAWLLTQ